MKLSDISHRKLTDPIRSLQQQGDIEEALLQLKTLLSNETSPHPAVNTLYGVLLLLNQESEKGMEIINETLSHPPSYSEWASDLGFGLLLSGKREEALEKLEHAISLDNPDAAAFNRLGALYLSQDNIEKSSWAFKEALLRDPDKAEIHNNLGGIFLRMGKLDEALTYYERALSIKEDLPQAQNGRNAIRLEFSRADEIILEVNEKLEKETDDEERIRLFKYMASVLESTGRPGEACTQLKNALSLDTENISVLYQLGMIFFDAFEYVRALTFFQDASEKDPDNLRILSAIAKCYSELGKHDKALETAEKLFEISPDDPLSYLTRAVCLSFSETFEDASEDLNHVISTFPGCAEAWGILGQNRMQEGDIEEAITCFEKASELNPSALSHLIEARIFPDDEKTIEKMKRIAVNPLIHPDPRISMCFSLSRLFEKKENYHEAFEFAEKGNNLVKRSQVYHFQNHKRYMDRIREVFTPELMDSLKGKGSLSERPVFIVGMPRSGTTLMEQILSSHPDVFGAGELSYIPSITTLMPRVIKTKAPYPSCMDELKGWMVSHAAFYYLKKIKALDADALKVTDKLPQNFIHIGLISAIFPKATIIHIKRNLKDIAISNYFTNFKFRNGILGYAFSLEDTARMLRCYEEMIRHYKDTLNISFLEVDYESLIEQPEKSIRQILNRIGLSWDDRVLQFHKTQRVVKTASMWQVRQPLYTSSKQRWKNYETFLDPLTTILEDE